MNTSIENRVTYRLFIGYLLTSEVRMHLHQSKTWKHVAVLPADRGVELVEVRHSAKSYIGRYLTEGKVTIAVLNEMALAIRERLQVYCPECNFSSAKIYLFPQVFVA